MSRRYLGGRLKEVDRGLPVDPERPLKISNTGGYEAEWPEAGENRIKKSYVLFLLGCFFSVRLDG